MLRGVHMQHMHEAAVELGVKERSRQAGQVPGGSVEANKLREEWVEAEWQSGKFAIVPEGQRWKRPQWPLHLRVLARLRYFDRCGGCGWGLLGVKFDLDHLQALATGGNNRFDNAQPLCASCHRAKTRCDGTGGVLDCEARVLAVHMAHTLGYMRGNSVFENSVVY